MNLTDNTITSRAQAKAQGLKKYFTGNACPKGHIDFRETSNGHCVACALVYRHGEGKEKLSRWNKSPKGKAYNKQYGILHRAKRRNYLLQRTYGITTVQYDAMLSAQNNKCAICSNTFDASTKLLKPNVDHNHDTGAVRELLCHGCNMWIGLAKENPQIMDAGKRYVRRHNAS